MLLSPSGPVKQAVGESFFWGGGAEIGGGQLGVPGNGSEPPSGFGSGNGSASGALGTSSSRRSVSLPK